MKHSNRTQAPKTDPDARLLRKGNGLEAWLVPLGTSIVATVSWVVRARQTSIACGPELKAEVKSALDLAAHHMKPSQALTTDWGHDCRSFTLGLRQLGERAHPLQRTKESSIDRRTTRIRSHEEGMKQTKLRWIEKVGWAPQLMCSAFNLRKLPRTNDKSAWRSLKKALRFRSGLAGCLPSRSHACRKSRKKNYSFGFGGQNLNEGTSQQALTSQ